MSSKELPDWDDLPEAMRDQFPTEEQYEVWRAQHDDFAMDMEPKITHTPDLKTIAVWAREFPSPDGRGMNRQLSAEVLEQLDPEGVHVLKPLMIHRHVGGQDAEAHMRVLAWLKLTGQEEAVQVTMDVPMDAFNQLPTDDEYRAAVGMPPRNEGWQDFLSKFWQHVQESEPTDRPEALVVRRGPFGTNEGDKWLGEGSAVQQKLDEEGHGDLKVVHEMMRQEDGSLEEAVYVTAEAGLIEEARQGTDRWIAEQATRN